MRMRYPNDALDVVAQQQLNPSTGGVVTVFRMVCGDCPGKVRTCNLLYQRSLTGRSQLYIPGPGDTLSNFEIHLKNRNHRGRVQFRSQPRRSLL